MSAQALDCLPRLRRATRCLRNDWMDAAMQGASRTISTGVVTLRFNTRKLRALSQCSDKLLAALLQALHPVGARARQEKVTLQQEP